MNDRKLLRPYNFVVSRIFLFCALLCMMLVSCTGRTDAASGSSAAAGETTSQPYQCNVNAGAETAAEFPFINPYVIITDEKMEGFETCPSVSEFLGRYGFAGTKPVYTYDHTACREWGTDFYTNTKKIELYCDREAKKGCIIIYGHGKPSGIAFGERQIVSYQLSGDPAPMFFHPLATLLMSLRRKANLPTPSCIPVIRKNGQAARMESR